jgi:hypothetical protein
VGTEKSGADAGSGDDLHRWFAGRLPEGWFTGTPEVMADRDEITVVCPLADLDVPDDAPPAVRAAAIEGRARQFREDTREHRIEIAREAEHKFGRKVSWGIRHGDLKVMFTTLSVPVMTRLRQAERRVLDTLVDAGVARSRSDALAWCVRLVGEHEESWLGQLRDALRRVEEVRAEGPQA